MKRNKKNINNVIWYVLATVIPMMVNFIKTPILTRYFLPDDMGKLSLINTNFSYINMICYIWISAAIWKFYYKYEENLNELLNNINFLILSSLLANILITTFWICITENFTMKLIILTAMITNFISQILAIFIVLDRLKNRAKIFAGINILISVFGLIFLIFLIYLFKCGIVVYFISTLIPSIFVFLFYYFNNRDRFFINFKKINYTLIKEVVNYGVLSSIISFNILILTSSDRYAIKYFSGFTELGIYNQIYQLSEYSIVTFTMIYFNIINPVLLRSYEETSFDENIQYKLKLGYILIMLPLTLYFSIFSKQISNLILGEEFRIGYKIMPFVMASSFINGVSQFYSTKFKYLDKSRIVIKGLLISSVLNIIGNIIFIPIIGYEVAAITTLISYIFVLVYYKCNDSKYFGKIRYNRDKRKELIYYYFIIIIQVIAHYMLYRIFGEFSIFMAIVEGSFFVILIYIYIYKKFDVFDIIKKS